MQQNRNQTLDDVVASAANLAGAHARAAARYRRGHLWLGVPAVSLAAIATTAAFVALEGSASFAARAIASAVTLLVVVLTTLQNFLRLAEHAEAHRGAAAAYRAVQREIRFFVDEYNAVDSSLSEEQVRDSLRSIRTRLDELESRAPDLAPRDLHAPPASEEGRHRRDDLEQRARA